MEYPIVVAPLSPDEGGGYIAYVPDLQGCMSDGESPEEAVRNLLDAAAEWIAAYRAAGREVPSPNSKRAPDANEQVEQALEMLAALIEKVDDLAADVETLKHSRRVEWNVQLPTGKWQKSVRFPAAPAPPYRRGEQ